MSKDAVVTDHFFTDDPEHPGQCAVVVPVNEGGEVVGTCCGYPAEQHKPTPPDDYDPAPEMAERYTGIGGDA